MPSLEIFSSLNFDLVAVAMATAAIAVIGFSIFLTNRESITNQTFFLFALTIIAYALSNYLSYKIIDPGFTIWLLRSIIFFATWASFLLFQLFYVFPHDAVRFSKTYSFILMPFVFIVSLLTLTPLIFSDVKEFPSGGSPAVASLGPLMPLFGLTSALLVISAIVVLVRKYLRAVGVVKKQLLFIVLGSAVTFVAILIFNILLPLVFENARYIVFAPVLFFPFLGLTAYAIVRYRLFNIKLVAVAALSFLLSSVVIIQVVFSSSLEELIFGASQFLLIVIFSVWLLQATWREIEQREQIEKLAKDLKRANDRLTELDRLKSEFISLASHQLRAPLTSIKGYASLILDGTYGDISGEVREGAERIFESSNSMARSVEDFLNVSRIEQGEMKYDFATGDFAELAETITERMKPVADKKGLSIQCHNCDQQLPVAMDSYKIEQVITNLVDNAIKYTPQGTVEVTASQEGTMARISVKDSGVGLSKEAISKLFQRFTRAEGAGRVNVTGTGLGLYVAKQMVDAHKGTIWAESEGEGKGTTFIVELPLVGDGTYENVDHTDKKE